MMIVYHLKIIIVTVFRTSYFLLPVLQHSQIFSDLLNPLLDGIHHCLLKVADLSQGLTRMLVVVALLRVLIVGELRSVFVI